VYWKIQIAVLTALSLLAGCGDGGTHKSTPTELTGVLHAKIQGVAYRTASRTGKTDANGSFKYVSGETVTFSVGGIELGSAPGASNISLFTLAGMTPPTSELGLRRELDRMRYTATPLSNAANRARLLLALDADGNPANGIDVSSFDSALATEKLSFDAGLYEFPGKMSRLAPGMNQNIPASFPLEWLYRSLGVKMAGNVPVRSTTDEHNDGVIDSARWNEVDAAGDVVSTFIDQDGDGTPDVTISYERDALGRVTRQHTIRDFNLDGKPDSDHTVVTTYDVHGNSVRVVEWEDRDADGSIDSDNISDRTFDSYGRELSATYGLDDNHDGTVDSREVDTYTRDARGNLLRELREVDQDMDGQTDARYVTDNTWDSADRPLTSSYQRDFDADGHVESSQRSTASYDSSGRGQEYDVDYDVDGDGVYEQRDHTRYEYDAAGNIWSFSSDYQDEQLEYRTTGESTYDRDRRPLTLVYTYDFGLDGTVDTANRQTYTYDSNGFELAWENASTIPTTGAAFLGGWLDSVTYSYTPEGAQLTSILATDFDADGVPELSRRDATEYAPSNDALGQIVEQYFALF
jgi:hypothetical protein